MKRSDPWPNCCETEFEDEMKADANGKYVLYEDHLAEIKKLGWHENCAETPCPTMIEPGTGIVVKWESGGYEHVSLVHCYNPLGYYGESKSSLYIRENDITHWMEIPEVGD